MRNVSAIRPVARIAIRVGRVIRVIRFDLPILAMLARRWAVCAARWRQRRDLAELDDRLLRDVGITRDQARRESSRPFWD